MAKKWYLSKTLWVNLIGIGAIIAQSKLGFVLDPGTQAAILAVVNVILRAVTKSEVVW